MPIIENKHIINDQEVVIYIEVDKVPGSESPYQDVRDAGQVVSKAISVVRDVFGEGLELAHNCATRVVDSIDKMKTNVRPDEFELEFAIKLDAEAGAVLTKLGSEAQLKVTMTWKPNQPL